MTAVLRRAAGAPFALVVAVLLLGTGVAGAATGGTLLLGRANTATTTTVLSTTRGAPLDLRGPSTTRPLSVSSSVVVPHLNADLLDGLTSSQLQRRASATCSTGRAMTGLGADGRPSCADLEPAGTLQTRAVSGTTDAEVALVPTDAPLVVTVARVGTACALRFASDAARTTSVTWSSPLTHRVMEPGDTVTTTASTDHLQVISWAGGSATLFLTWVPSSSRCAYQGTVTS